VARIVVVGSFNMDLVVRMPAIPRPGETLLGGVFATYPGGKGANQAVAAARLGGEVTMIGRVGADAFGDQLLAIARAEGIDTRFVGVDPHAATGVALIEVDAIKTGSTGKPEKQSIDMVLITPENYCQYKTFAPTGSTAACPKP